MEYRFLNCCSDFCHLILRQNDNLFEIFTSEFQNLKKISKKCVFFENLKNTFWRSLKKHLPMCYDGTFVVLRWHFLWRHSWLAPIGSLIYELGSILIRPVIFSLGLVTFSKFLTVYYLCTCLVTTALQTNALFINPLWYPLQSVLWCFPFSSLVGA